MGEERISKKTLRWNPLAERREAGLRKDVLWSTRKHEGEYPRVEG